MYDDVKQPDDANNPSCITDGIKSFIAGNPVDYPFEHIYFPFMSVNILVADSVEYSTPKVSLNRKGLFEK